MNFLSPARLWLLLVPLALAAAYVAMQFLRRRHTVRFTNVELLASVAPKRPGWRRHLPAGALLLGLAVLAVGFARPTADRRVPREKATAILALDVSESMAATDVDPTRLAAAQAAAAKFTASIPQPLRLGLVSFSGTAQVLVAPTADRRQVELGISRLALGPRTAIGEAIFASLDAVALDSGSTGTNANGKPTPATIVLMSDGSTTSGRSNDAAVQAAKNAHVPVTTIAYGTPGGTVQLEGQTIPVPVDKTALKAIADSTGGRFFEAADAGQLGQVYQDIGRAVGYDVVKKEITADYLGVGMFIIVLAAAGSLLWMSRLP